MTTIDHNAVNNRNRLTQSDFEQLNPDTQKAVMTAKLSDKMIRPAMEQATKLSQQAVTKMRDSLKGDGENSA